MEGILLTKYIIKHILLFYKIPANVVGVLYAL